MKFPLEYQYRSITDFKEKNFVEMKYFYDTVSKLVPNDNSLTKSQVYKASVYGLLWIPSL